MEEIDKMILSEAMSIVWVGIDVSKKSLDLAIWRGGKKYAWRKFDASAPSIIAAVRLTRREGWRRCRLLPSGAIDSTVVVANRQIPGSMGLR